MDTLLARQRAVLAFRAGYAAAEIHPLWLRLN